MKPPSSEGRHLSSQQRNNWLGRTDLVTFDVFKRSYWSHLPQTLTKGIGVSLWSPILYAHSSRHTVPSVAFSDIIGTVFSGLLYFRL